MPTVLYAGDDFPQPSVLVEDSLYETIYRLEETYWGLRHLSKKEAKRTFKWIRSRIDYGREDVLVRTEYDRLRTGEDRASRAKAKAAQILLTYR